MEFQQMIQRFTWNVKANFLGKSIKIRMFRMLFLTILNDAFHYENMPIQYNGTFFIAAKTKCFRWKKKCNLFVIFAWNRDCGYLLEPPCWEIRKNNVYPCKPHFFYIKVGFWGGQNYIDMFRDGVLIYKKIILFAKEHDVSATKWPFSRRSIHNSWERPPDGRNVLFLGK